LLKDLGDVRLRPQLARTLALVGDKDARPALVKALASERYQGARVALAESLVSLGAEQELVAPLVRFLGVPDPIQGGLSLALRAGELEAVGGPSGKELRRLTAEGELGAPLHVVVPRGGNGAGCRILLRVQGPPEGGEGAELRIGRPAEEARIHTKDSTVSYRKIPEISPTLQTRIPVRPSAEPQEVFATLDPALGARPGRPLELVIVGDRRVKILAVAVVPLADELPPPAPEPWKPGQGGQGTAPSSPPTP